MKKCFFIIVLSVLSCSIFAQSSNETTNRKFNFGFSLGSNYSVLKSFHQLPDNHSIDNGFGMQLGVFMDYNPIRNWTITPMVEMGFNHANIIKNSEQDQITYEVFPNSLDMMVHLQYNLGIEKANPYLFVGPQFKVPLYLKELTTLQYSTAPNFSIDFGVGVEIKLKYFTIAPELRYSQGFSNVNNDPNYISFQYNQVAFALKFKS
jgi:hypothetical protein